MPTRWVPARTRTAHDRVRVRHVKGMLFKEDGNVWGNGTTRNAQSAAAGVA
ncbi:hypothetical protein HUT18_32070 [Streptomyces sp. NA04227]|uniref:hypothetical protein n=1 Tax=Streptomyces sp. NA04227 TaxID=2742136 RepID=UPI00159042F4|nr:hypothetical protein [Streptomyces sp. NA04227]QKW10361.1 hypothetical protein HUT18_32070 [Streptomyces sp. NA04227]